VIDVEGEAHGHAPTGRVGDRARHQPGGRLLEVEVVEREVERTARGRNELARVLGDLECALASVGQGADVDRQA
jgi:hypothetical protein